jgi:hypothetical protein
MSFFEYHTEIVFKYYSCKIENTNPSKLNFFSVTLCFGFGILNQILKKSVLILIPIFDNKFT